MKKYNQTTEPEADTEPPAVPVVVLAAEVSDLTLAELLPRLAGDMFTDRYTGLRVVTAEVCRREVDAQAARAAWRAAALVSAEAKLIAANPAPREHAPDDHLTGIAAQSFAKGARR